MDKIGTILPRGLMGRKYLFVINSFLAGGAERSLLELLPRLAEEGIAAIVVILQYRDVGFEEEARDAGHDIRLLQSPSRLGKIRELRRLIKSERPDLVYTSLFDSDIAGRLAAAGIDVPVITNLANTSYDPVRLNDPNIDPRRLRLVKFIDGWTARHLTDHFHAVSQAVKDSTVAELRIDPGVVTVVKRGRDPSRLGRRTPERRTAARTGLGVPEDVALVVTAGRQEFQKGHVYLVEAFAGVVTDRPDARLLIAGREGNATGELERSISDLGLEEVVTLLGHRDDLPEVLAAADLFVFPSLYEGLGGALIEALALELPVVASDLPAIREVVTHGESAELVAPGDAPALRAAIAMLLADPDRLSRYSAASRRRFEAEFDSTTATEKMVAMLDAVARK